VVLDDLDKRASLAHVLARRPEAYHADLLRQLDDQNGGDAAEDDGPASPHDVMHSKVPDLAERLVYDPHDRQLFVDHLLPEGATLESIDTPESYRALADLRDVSYEMVGHAETEECASVTLEGTVSVPGLGVDARLELTKTIALSTTKELEARYGLTYHGSEPLSATFVVESALAMVPLPEAGIEARGAEQAVMSRSALLERGLWSGFESIVANTGNGDVDVTLRAEPRGCDLWRFPIETVSQSEDGAELVYQGSVLAFAWPLCLDPEATLELNVTLTLT